VNEWCPGGGIVPFHPVARFRGSCSRRDPVAAPGHGGGQEGAVTGPAGSTRFQIDAAFASACSRSAIRSSASSRPIDSLTTSGAAPAAICCSAVSWRWVVEAE